MYVHVYCPDLLLLFSHKVVSNSLRPHDLQHPSFPCPSLSSRVCSNSCPLSQRYHPTVSSPLFPSPPDLNLSHHQTLFQWVSFPDSSVGKESACNAGNPSSIPGLGRSAGERIDYPLQYFWASLVAQCRRHGFYPWVGKIAWRRERLPTSLFCLENSIHCIVHGVPKSQTGMRDLHITWIRWPKYWSFCFSFSPSNEYSGLISSRNDWFDLLAVQETLKSLS